MDLVYNRSRIEPQRSFFRLRKSSSWQGLFSISTNFFFVENLPAHTLVENGRRVSSSGFHRKTKNTALWLPAHLVAQNDNDVSSARVPSGSCVWRNFFLLQRGEAVLTEVAGLVEGCCGKVGQDRPYVHQALCEVRGALTRATTWNFLSDDQTSCMIVLPPQ